MSGRSGRTFTEEQAAAIDRRSGALLVSAAAGSGKTTVLVERFVRSVLDDGVAPASMLAITFTDKAAGELRARVRARFLELGERRLAQETEAAWISTIHGFCARVLRQHAVTAGLAPGFVVLDEASARELRSDAFDEAFAGFLDGATGARDDALDLVAAYRPDRLATMVLESHDALRAAGREPRLPLSSQQPYPRAERDALEAACATALAELGGAAGKLAERARGRVEECAGLLAELPAEQLPVAVRLDAVRFASGKTKALQGAGVAGYLTAREIFAAACADRAAQPVLVMLDELLDRFATAYATGKRERGGLDYDDLELATRDLFRAEPTLASAYAERFERVMVDEFQDVNRLQLQLLSPLERDNAFLVGDELQSIYGFRHASVEVFRERRAALAATGAEASLRINFRSRPEILAAVNRVPHDAEPIVAGRASSGAEPRVELLLCDRDAPWPDDDPLPASQPWRRAEARIVAGRIAELVASGEHAAGDVVVLLRASGDMASYENALEDAGLATLAAGGRGFWARQQVLDLCAYLAALVNPRDERALLGVLASPLGANASADALALLGLARRNSRRSLWELLRSGDDAWAAALPLEEHARIADFVAVFAGERTRSPRLGLDALLERAVRRSRYDEHVLRLPGGVRRLANVAKLIRLAAAFEATRGRDVRALVDRALSELEAGAREPDAPVELAGLDAVRLMTMHAAKGLEFPVVVLADLGRAPNAQTPDLLVDGERAGLRLVSMHGPSQPTLGYIQLRDERLARDAEEEHRIMHVAMTRAEERLILAGGVCVTPWPEPKPAAAPIVWLAPALAPGLSDALAAGIDDRVVDGVRVAVRRPEAVMPLFGVDPPIDDGDPPARAPDAPDADEGLGPVVRPAPSLPTLSYSALSRYAQCGYRFYLERLLRLPPRDPPPAEPAVAGELARVDGIDALMRGSLAHELLDLLAAEELRTPTEDEVRAQAALHDVELRADEVDDLRALVAAAADNDVMRRVHRARSVHREQSFAVALDGHTSPQGTGRGALPLLNGIVDVLAWEHDGGALVVDYKTDRLGGAGPEQVVAGAYGLQRRIYALAALRAGASRVEVAHLFLERPGAPAVAVYRPGDAAGLLDDVLGAAEALLAGSFPVAERPHRELCATCPGRGGLCSWPEDVVLQPLGEAVGD